MMDQWLERTLHVWMEATFYVDGVLSVHALWTAVYFGVGVIVFLVASTLFFYWDREGTIFALVFGFSVGFFWGFLVVLYLIYLVPLSLSKVLIWAMERRQ